jgi:homeobox protein cut-like
MAALGAGESNESVFQIAVSKWRDIDLSSLQSQLDKQGMEIIESQKDFLVERKELSTKTKLFRKLPDDEKLLQVMSLLKGLSYYDEAANNGQRTKERSMP